MSPRRKSETSAPLPRAEWPEVLTARELAEYLRINYMTVLRMTHEAALPALAIGREFRYLRSEIDNLMRTPAKIDPDLLVGDALDEPIPGGRSREGVHA